MYVTIEGPLNEGRYTLCSRPEMTFLSHLPHIPPISRPKASFYIISNARGVLLGPESE